MNKKEANRFIKYFAQIAKENPTINFDDAKTEKIVYHELIKLGVPDNSKDIDLSKNVFGYWINKFKNKPNINVFVDPEWEYFCQFTNGDLSRRNNHIKLYLPSDKRHIKDVANQIFEFLRVNNIEHQSKIAKQIRFDDIVVRLSNINDLHHLLNFINTNNFIKKHLLTPNPFAFTYNNIAITSDGFLSYNSIISGYIRLYIANLKRKNTLQNASYDDFIDFIKEYYTDKFIHKNNLANVPNEFKILESNPTHLMNLKHITELILKLSDDSFSLKDYLNHFNQITNTDFINNEYKDIYNHLHKKESQGTGKVMILSKIDILEINKLLLETIKALTIKYNSQNEAVDRINSLFATKNYTFITRDNGLRYILINANFVEKLDVLLAIQNKSLNTHINFLLNKTKNNSLDIQNVETLMKEYIEVMSNKYSMERAIMNMSIYLFNNDPTNITRDNGLRFKIYSSKFRDDLETILAMNNVDLNDYFNYIIKKYDLNDQRKKQ